MRGFERLLVVAALSVLAVGVGACGSGGSEDSGGSASTVTQTTTVREPAPEPEEPSTQSSSGEGSAQSWTMPDLTGKDLQTAQDSIQSLTDNAIFYTESHDASGQGRNQVLDSGWQVCDQDPAPGTEITPDTNIDFGVVRVDTEQCP